MYEGIKQAGRFIRGFVNPNYRSDIYYEKFDVRWRHLHRSTLEGMEVEARIHHRDEFRDDCSLVNWVVNFGKI